MLANLAIGFAAYGTKVDVVLARATGPYLASLPSSVNVVDLRARSTLASTPALARYLRYRKPNHLISFQDHANIVAILACKMAGVATQTTVTVHSTWSRALVCADWKTRAVARLVRLCYPYADHIVAVSRGVADDLASTCALSRGSINVIYNPVIYPELFEAAGAEPDTLVLAPGRTPLVVAIGRLTAAKDFTTLLRAFAILRNRKSNARLIILGEGEDRSRLEDLIRELDITDCATLPGFVTNPYSYLRRASVFVLSSAWEGLPTVLIEALALGVPVVSTDCPSGPREILNGGEHGRLVPVGDAEKLAKQIESQLNTPMRPTPYSWERFRTDVVIERYMQVLSRKRQTY